MAFRATTLRLNGDFSPKMPSAFEAQNSSSDTADWVGAGPTHLKITENGLESTWLLSKSWFSSWFLSDFSAAHMVERQQHIQYVCCSVAQLVESPLHWNWYAYAARISSRNAHLSVARPADPHLLNDQARQGGKMWPASRHIAASCIFCSTIQAIVTAIIGST